MNEPNLKSLSDWLGAAVYLIETRSLTWFAVNNNSINLSQKARLEVLAILQKEVEAACNCENSIRRIYLKDKSGQPCGQEEYRQLVNSAVENIKTILGGERKLQGYETGR